MFSKTTQITTCPNSVGDVVRKNTFFKALAAGVFSLSLISGPAAEAGQSTCPVFNSAMVDAAAVHVPLRTITFAGSDDVPSTGALFCDLVASFGVSDFRFSIEVEDDDGPSSAGLSVSRTENGQTEIIVNQRGPSGRRLSVAEAHACRAQVLKSLVWNQYCAPALP